MKVFNLIGCFFAGPVKLIGRGLARCFCWLGWLWNLLPCILRRPFAMLYGCLPVRILRKTLFVVICFLFWFILFVLAGGLGPTVRYAVPPIAKMFHVPLTIDRCVILPLGGYVNIEGVTVANPKFFLEQKPRVYAETPLVKLGQVKFDFAMRSLFTSELQVDEILLTGLDALYACDLDTTNVDQLIKEIVGEPSAEAPAPAPEEAPTAEEPVAKDQAPAPKINIAYVHLENNRVEFRKFITIPLPLPPLTLHNVDNHSLKEHIDGVVKPIVSTYQTFSKGFGKGLTTAEEDAKAVGKEISEDAAAMEEGVVHGAEATVEGIKNLFR
ncbi:MAG: hypothetical protein RR417_07035 [Kiritimatiellia bacterium]